MMTAVTIMDPKNNVNAWKLRLGWLAPACEAVIMVIFECGFTVTVDFFIKHSLDL